MSDKWRVVDADGKVHEAPTLRWYEPARWWYCGDDWATDARSAVVQWADEHVPNWTDVVPPNQPTRAEAIAAAVTHAAEAARLLERERCAGWAAHVANEAVELAEGAGRDRECAKHHESRMYAAVEVAERINSGEPVPHE